jgi:mannose/cellobiose epimerase-like protein (N-acyl-D-glucosamine 2-epimerase family)
LAGEVVAECGGNGVGEGEWRDVVEHGACVALGSYQASECGWGVACHDGFSGGNHVAVQSMAR